MKAFPDTRLTPHFGSSQASTTISSRASTMNAAEMGLVRAVCSARGSAPVA